MKMMQLAALGYCHWENYESEKILIVGINSGLTQTKFVYIEELERLNGQEKKDLIHDLKVLNWFTSIEKIENIWTEYPLHVTR